MEDRMCVRNVLSLMSFAVFIAGPQGVAAQDGCRGWNGDRQNRRHCEEREERIAVPSGGLVVDGMTNGGIEVIGERRSDVLVIARVVGTARTLDRAEEIARGVRISTSGGRIAAEGPRQASSREWWSVSYEIRVPARIDLDLTSHNGGLAVEGVTGAMRLETLNGGIHLLGVGGDVRAETRNGGLHIELLGSTWDGRGLDAVTSNGGVHLQIPPSYSAQLETGTTNGGIDIDFPVTVRGRIGRRITTELGRGGPLIRAITTNGGVDVRRG
jgi:hypothetical protein